jgi:hypothetical protein
MPFYETCDAKKLSQHHQQYHGASKMIIFVDTKILLFLWSVNKFSTSASRSGNFVRISYNKSQRDAHFIKFIW